MKIDEYKYQTETLKRIKEICDDVIYEATAIIVLDDGIVNTEQRDYLWNAIENIEHLLSHIDDYEEVNA